MFPMVLTKKFLNLLKEGDEHWDEFLKIKKENI
jgi:hypothetical protein